MGEHWYVLRSKPNKENSLWREARARGYEVFYPQIRVQPVNPRSRKVRPYFPGYMFVKVDLTVSGLSALIWMPYSYGLVSFDAEPCLIPDELINAIQKRVDDVNAAGGELFDKLRAGEKVAIQAGPFEGYQAIFDTRLPGKERVRVLLILLGEQQMSLELSAGQIRRNKSSYEAGR